MNGTMLIRPATEHDLPAILAIVNEVIANTLAIYAYAPQTLEERESWFRGQKAGNWPVIVAELGGQVVGFGSIGMFRTRPAYKYSGEHSVHVHADHRGKGIGGVLLRALIEEAQRLELRTLVGGIDSGNTGSIAFHARHGFVECARMKDVAYKFGRWLDLVFMQLILPGPMTPDEK
ncbi:MAG: N-acetyltransferase [Flavobacteriales bacterium]|nr:N-acetyltransferase [Flavobacteriales bacterium]